MRLKSFMPCLAPKESISEAGTCSGRLETLVGRLYNTQCTHVPMGASGSSQISARLLAAAGTPSHCTGGDTLAPSHEYLVGITSPARKTELVIAIAMSNAFFFICSAVKL